MVASAAPTMRIDNSKGSSSHAVEKDSPRLTEILQPANEETHRDGAISYFKGFHDNSASPRELCYRFASLRVPVRFRRFSTRYSRSTLLKLWSSSSINRTEIKFSFKKRSFSSSRDRCFHLIPHVFNSRSTLASY